MRRYPTHGFGRNTHYHRRRPRPADQRHHGWYVWPLVRPVGHGGCANGGQPRRRSSDSGNPRSAVQGQLRHCLDRRLGARRVPGLHVATRRRRDAAAGRGVCAETCALLLDANCNRVHGLGERHMGAATGTSAPFPPSLPSPPVPRRSPRRGPYCAITASSLTPKSPVRCSIRRRTGGLVRRRLTRRATPRPTRSRQCAVWSRPVFGQWPRWFVAKCHSKPL